MTRTTLLGVKPVRQPFAGCGKCACCKDLTERLRTGRDPDPACSCLDHPPEQRCDCAFCEGVQQLYGARSTQLQMMRRPTATEERR